MPPDPRFELDPRLKADTLSLGDLPLSRVLLMDDARFPWLVLVPRGYGWSELDQLDPAQRAQLMHEVALASQALRDGEAVDKINVGALGNIVRQLHVHVVARRVGDPAWPGPVWGHGQRVPHGGAQAARRRDGLDQRLRHLAGPDYSPVARDQPLPPSPVGK